MHEWYSSSSQVINDAGNDFNEIFNIIEAFFDRLKNNFNIEFIDRTGSIIPTPSRFSKKYIFENKYTENLKFCKVLKSGLKQGNIVIYPCV